MTSPHPSRPDLPYPYPYPYSRSVRLRDIPGVVRAYSNLSMTIFFFVFLAILLGMFGAYVQNVYSTAPHVTYYTDYPVTAGEIQAPCVTHPFSPVVDTGHLAHANVVNALLRKEHFSLEVRLFPVSTYGDETSFRYAMQQTYRTNDCSLVMLIDVHHAWCVIVPGWESPLTPVFINDTESLWVFTYGHSHDVTYATDETIMRLRSFFSGAPTDSSFSHLALES